MWRLIPFGQDGARSDQRARYLNAASAALFISPGPLPARESVHGSAGVLGFGGVALLPVTEWLLTEAHEFAAPAVLTAMFSVGFLISLLFGMVQTGSALSE